MSVSSAFPLRSGELPDSFPCCNHPEGWMEPVAEERDGMSLFERERELGVLAGALERLAAGQGSMVLVEGPAGIGKTRLLGEAGKLVRDDRITVRTARGGQLEREMPFGVARQLLEPLVERVQETERSRLLAGSAALSLIAFGRADAADANAEADPFAPIHGLYWLVANLCDRQPLMLVIDDAHWADTQSLRWLDYLARRASDTAALIVIGARTGEADEPTELEQIRVDADAMLRPDPLSRTAIEGLIAAELGSSPAVEFSQVCGRATGGNPFLLSEVLRTLSTDSTAPDAAAARELTSLVPAGVARFALRRLHGFGDEAISIARAVAVLGGAPQLRHVSALARVDEKRTSDLCDQLRDAELLAQGHPIDFVHPLIRTAIYRELSEEARSDAHRRAAELISSTGGDAREVAPHLMACAPNGDPWVVAQLRKAAHEAMAAGAPDAARRYLERALREPAREELDVTYELGRALWGANPIEAPEVLVSVAERADDPALHLQALEDAAWTYFDCGNLERAVHWLGRLVEDIPPDRREETLAAEASLYCLQALNVGRHQQDSARIAAVVEGSWGYHAR